MPFLFILPIYACRIFRRKGERTFRHCHFPTWLISSQHHLSGMLRRPCAPCSPPVAWHTSTLLPSVTVTWHSACLSPTLPCGPWWHVPGLLSTKLPVLLPASDPAVFFSCCVRVIPSGKRGTGLFCSGPTFVLWVLPDSVFLLLVLATTKGWALVSPSCTGIQSQAPLRRLKVVVGAVGMCEVPQSHHNATLQGCAGGSRGAQNGCMDGRVLEDRIFSLKSSTNTTFQQCLVLLRIPPLFTRFIRILG